MAPVPVFCGLTLCKKILFQPKIQPVSKFRTFLTSRLFNGQVSFKLSDIGEGIREVVIKEWFVKVGDKVSQFDNICEVQSDKASVTITSRYDGVITKLYYDIDELALVGNPLVDVETNDDINEEPVSKQLPVSENRNTVSEENEFPNVAATKNRNNETLCIPAVRRLAKDNKIDLTEVQGSGKNGRILKEDILHCLEILTKTEKPVRVDSKQNGSSITKPITGFIKAMFKTMTESLKIPHFVYSDEINVTKLSNLRKELKGVADSEKIKITFLPFFIKAASNSLGRYPVINSSLDEKNENIIFHQNHNIGIAMDTQQGLAVPVIKSVETKSVLEIAIELNDLIERGKKGIFSPSDLSGATFSLSNIGVVGGTYTKPVILPPQVAIIAIGKAQILPRFDAAGNVVPEEIINLSGSADHRVIDGVTMANFIKTLKKQIENPNLLFLNL